MESVELKEPPLVILIHGTFVRDALWLSSDGVISTAIKNMFGSDVLIEKFVWSGYNSHRARFDAARELASFVAECGEPYPDRPVAFVAHSHGGNVALWSLS